MGTKKRSKDEIIARILSVCSEGASKTKIVYDANLNFKTINPYLEMLVNSGMIKIKKGRFKIYKTTHKGEEMLTHFEQFEARLNTR